MTEVKRILKLHLAELGRESKGHQAGATQVRSAGSHARVNPNGQERAGMAARAP